MEIVLIVLPNILPMPFHSTFASVVFPFTALICKALSGNIWRIVLGILSAWNATKPSIGATGRVSRCGADTGSTGAAVSNCAPNALAALSNVLSAKSIVALRNLPLIRFNFVLLLFKAYSSVIHSSARYFSGSFW